MASAGEKRLLISLITISMLIPLFIPPSVKPDMDIARAEPDTIIVDITGNGDYTTIQSAIDSAQTGDTIYVRTGIYDEHIDIDKGITLIGEGMESTWIRGSGQSEDIVEIMTDWVNITGFTVTNGVPHILNTGVELHYADNCRVEFCNISNNGVGFFISSSHNNVIVDNIVQTNDWGFNIASLTYYNYIYHNNIISNEDQVMDGGNNFWHNNSQGNYWSDYTGLDNGADGRTAGDGIGDTNIPHNDLDDHPFMEPWGWLIPDIPTLQEPVVYNPDGEYMLSWTEGANTSRYILEESETPSFEFSEVVYMGPNTSLKFIRQPNGTYHYRLKAYNDFKESDWSNTTEITVDWVPDIPGNLMAVPYPPGNGNNVSWSNNLNDTSRYDLYFMLQNDWELLANVDFPQNAYNHSELIDGQKYQYKLQAFDVEGQYSDFSDVVEAIPKDTVAPRPPEGLSIIPNTHDSMTVKWESAEEWDTSGYNLYRSLEDKPSDWGDPISIIESPLTARYIDTGLEELTTYYYSITSLDEVPNESIHSDIASGGTKIGPRGPEVREHPDDLMIPEDTYDNTSVNLHSWFTDANGDYLTFNYTGNEHIRITVFQMNGTIIFEPETDWNGDETITFTASDGSAKVSDTINVQIEGVNDPPRIEKITSPRNNAQINGSTLVGFSVVFDDPDRIFGDIINISWYSNMSGQIGYGNHISTSDLPAGNHQITVKVKDTSEAISLSSVNISIIATAGDGQNNGGQGPADEIDIGSGGANNIYEILLLLSICIVVAIILLALFLILKKNKEKKTKPEVEAEKEVETKVKWSPMTGNAVYDVDAARVGSDGTVARLTKPVEGTGGVVGGALAGGGEALLLPKPTGAPGAGAGEGAVGAGEGVAGVGGAVPAAAPVVRGTVQGGGQVPPGGLKGT